jgi:chaperonin GroEL (HSP60 family)
MLVDSIGDVTITNDGATILKMLEVPPHTTPPPHNHPP